MYSARLPVNWDLEGGPMDALALILGQAVAIETTISSALSLGYALQYLTLLNSKWSSSPSCSLLLYCNNQAQSDSDWCEMASVGVDSHHPTD